MSFINEISKTIGEDYNESITENGAVGYATTQRPLLDLNFKVSSYRNVENEADIIREFMPAYADNKILALRWLFFVRDAREGLGERRYFRVIMKELARIDSDTIKKLLPLFAEYGRYDDLVMLIDSNVGTAVRDIIMYTITDDLKNMKNNKPISLLAKWLPSENTSSAETVRLAKSVISKLGVTPKRYRKILSALRGYLKIVEKSMSAKEWSEINYEAVPSRANLIYNDAFLRNDESRRREFLGKVKSGEAKINAGVLYPHDIVRKYRSKRNSWYSYSALSVDNTLEALWKALPDTVNGNSNTIVVADGSGSMSSTIGNTDVQAHDVADALAIYFAERCSGEFKNKYITFSSRPQLVSLNGDTLADNLCIASSHNECSNTNIEAVFNLILTIAIRNKMTQEEIPQNILIISDMEFDSATSADYYNR
ncbi:MAG: DUF2828 family protein, partial [Spirochaetia bacterium]|nr:DUF2828 family protein [Spirochaetia bacterium]